MNPRRALETLGLSLPKRDDVANTFVGGVPLVGPRMGPYARCGMRLADPSSTTILLGTQVCAIKQISVGAHCVIGGHCLLDGRGGLTIGENVAISGYAILISGSHMVAHPEGGRHPRRGPVHARGRHPARVQQERSRDIP